MTSQLILFHHNYEPSHLPDLVSNSDTRWRAEATLWSNSFPARRWADSFGAHDNYFFFLLVKAPIWSLVYSLIHAVSIVRDFWRLELKPKVSMQFMNFFRR